jgi:bifunctional non-homologous end joining protein LigD
MSPADRERLNALEVTAPATADEAEHFEICPSCGEAIDCRLLGDVLHHEEEGHAPLRKPS